MFDWPYLKSALRLGLFLGLNFGVVNLMFSWLFPLEDDTIAALLRFYGPMFFAWAFASFRAARRHGQLLQGVATGLIVAFATFCVFDVLNLEDRSAGERNGPLIAAFCIRGEIGDVSN